MSESNPYKSLVVLTAGRTGSQLILKNLSSYFGIPSIHSHNPLIEVPQQSLVIASLRRNDFDTIVSIILGRRTNEFVLYTNKQIREFEVPKEEFESCFWFVKCNQWAINHSFPSAVIVVFENLVNDSKYLFGLFGINKHTDYSVIPKSPYVASKLIKNYGQCQQWFDFLLSQTLTEDLKQSFVASMTPTPTVSN